VYARDARAATSLTEGRPECRGPGGSIERTGNALTHRIDNARSGTGGQLADLVGDPNLPDDRSTAERIAQWFNTAAFQPNALGTFGNSGRNGYRGPRYQALDLGLHKTFNSKGRTKIQLRVEAFNALNNVNFELPTSSQNSGTSGRSSRRAIRGSCSWHRARRSESSTSNSQFQLPKS
jgi:hypothetical protein